MPGGASVSPRTTASACRRPNSTRTGSPAATSASCSGNAYVYVRAPPPPAASIATSTIRGRVAVPASRPNSPVSIERLCHPPGREARAGPPRAPASDADPPGGVAGVLGGDRGLDHLGRPLDLARLVGDDVVVVVLPGELDRRVRLALLELVGRLGRPRLQPLEERLERRRD